MDYFDGLVASKLFGSSSSSKVTKPYVEYTVNTANQITGAKFYCDDAIPGYICNGQSVLENVDLSGCVNLTSIESMAFYNCPKLSTISIPDTVTSIGHSAFHSCTSLVLTELPNGLATLRQNAFTGCRSLALTKLPSGLTTIGDRAFQNCKGLVSVTFSARPFSSLYALFDGCTNLLDIYVPWAEGEIGYAPWGASNATIHYNWTEA